MTDDATSVVQDLEHQRFQAMIDDDFDRLGELLADDLVYTHSNASIDTKASYIEGMRTGRFDYRKADRTGETVTVWGDAAIITGEARLEVSVMGTVRSLHLRYLDVWRKGPGGWQMVAWQSTSVPAT